MNKKEYSIVLEEYQHSDQLQEQEKQLLEEARNACKTAYAPYSQFFVGAAVELEDGTIISGNNQENVAYPSGLCAERVALFYASAKHPGKEVKRMAIAVNTDKIKYDDPITPCGACRQVIAEYEIKQDKGIRIIMGGTSGAVYISESIEQLLPLMFRADHLKKD